MRDFQTIPSSFLVIVNKNFTHNKNYEFKAVRSKTGRFGGGAPPPLCENPPRHFFKSANFRPLLTSREVKNFSKRRPSRATTKTLSFWGERARKKRIFFWRALRKTFILCDMLPFYTRSFIISEWVLNPAPVEQILEPPLFKNSGSKHRGRKWHVSVAQRGIWGQLTHAAKHVPAAGFELAVNTEKRTPSKEVPCRWLSTMCSLALCWKKFVDRLMIIRVYSARWIGLGTYGVLWPPQVAEGPGAAAELQLVLSVLRNILEVTGGRRAVEGRRHRSLHKQAPRRYQPAMQHCRLTLTHTNFSYELPVYQSVLIHWYIIYSPCRKKFRSQFFERRIIHSLLTPQFQSGGYSRMISQRWIWLGRRYDLTRCAGSRRMRSKCRGRSHRGRRRCPWQGWLAPGGPRHAPAAPTGHRPTGDGSGSLSLHGCRARWQWAAGSADAGRPGPQHTPSWHRSRPAMHSTCIRSEAARTFQRPLRFEWFQPGKATESVAQGCCDKWAGWI